MSIVLSGKGRPFLNLSSSSQSELRRRSTDVARGQRANELHLEAELGRKRHFHTKLDVLSPPGSHRVEAFESALIFPDGGLVTGSSFVRDVKRKNMSRLRTPMLPPSAFSWKSLRTYVQAEKEEVLNISRIEVGMLPSNVAVPEKGIKATVRMTA